MGRLCGAGSVVMVRSFIGCFTLAHRATDWIFHHGARGRVGVTLSVESCSFFLEQKFGKANMMRLTEYSARQSPARLPRQVTVVDQAGTLFCAAIS